MWLPSCFQVFSPVTVRQMNFIYGGHEVCCLFYGMHYLLCAYHHLSSELTVGIADHKQHTNPQQTNASHWYPFMT